MSLTTDDVIGTKPLLLGASLAAGGFAILAVAADGGLVSGGASVTPLNVNQMKGTSKAVIIAGQVSEGVYAVVSVNSNGVPA